MLTPFSQSDAKAPKKVRKSSNQLTLWSIKRIPISTKTTQGPPLAEHPESFKSIASMWQVKGPRLPVEDVASINAKVDILSGAISERMGAHYKTTRKASLQYPSDVAAYFVLREVDDKATVEVPKHRLQALDFGVKALVEKK